MSTLLAIALLALPTTTPADARTAAVETLVAQANARIAAGEAPAAKIVLSSAAAQHTLFLQPYQQNGNGGRRYARNTRCLADRYRFVIVQLGDNFIRQA